MSTVKSKGRAKLSGLYPIIDLSLLCPKDVSSVAGEILEAGAGRINILQLRAKDTPAGAALKAALELRSITLAHSVSFIVNDRIDIALMSKADGVHLGNMDIPLREARKLLGTEKIIGLSTHSSVEALEAVRLGADYVSFGPIFKTTTKADAFAPGGLRGLAEVAESLKNSNIPITAIGGITEKSVAQAVASGASMAAVISDILLAGDICAKVKELIDEIDPSTPAR